MLKVSVITDGVSQDFRRAVEFARRFQLEGLELRSVWDSPVERLTLAQIQEIRKCLAGTELVISAVISPFLKCPIDDREAVEQHLRWLGRSIEIAEHLGCDLVCTATFFRNGALEAEFDRVTEAYERALLIAARVGVRLAVENEHTTMVRTGEELGRFLTRLGSPLARACWDPQEHYLCVEGQDEPHRGYEAVRGLVAHVHLKDVRFLPGRKAVEFVPLGEGEVGVAEQLRALLADGYRGFVSLDPRWRPHVLIPGAEELDPDFPIRTVAEYAAWVSMRRLKEMLAELLALDLGSPSSRKD
ncbi:MAG: sugar phosphate isomerase/epimerase [candidate division KSB1 bacterium]|nr:sugar phosphate isomerase/epimerase [candidate division KSB1 bacterium]